MQRPLPSRSLLALRSRFRYNRGMSTPTEPAPTLAVIAARIEAMEAELAALKEQVRQLQGPKPVRTLGDLYGILAGQVESTEADIDAALFRVDWEDDPTTESR